MPWLRRFFGTDALARDSQLRAEAARAVEGLDIEAALSAHRQWKQQLRACLMSEETCMSDEILDRALVCLDDRCDLGRWIHGKGRSRLGTFPGFAELLSHHRMFHHVAGNVMALREAGHLGAARRMLDDQFEDYSSRVAEDLRLLRDLVNTEPTHRD
ncbi:MAG: CZB domain-containing protein [Hydrogenophaga sp.]|nr:CZB domain-containing protein [Hydrogenophaga sp.]